MKIKKLFENWGMSGLKVNAGFLETEWKPQTEEADAAWELYIELLTRIATQPLPDDSGMESAALESVYSLFGITRSILRKYGTDCLGFAKIAIIVLNQVIRPFTARWHRLECEGAFDDYTKTLEFRSELKELQASLVNYMGMLAEIAGVEDISALTTNNSA